MIVLLLIILISVSTCKRDLEPIRYSRYVDECCEALSEAAEYATDVYAVHLAHLQVQAGKIAQIFGQGDSRNGLAFNSTPIAACVKVMKSELQLLKDNFRAESQGNGQFSNLITVQG